MDGHTTHLYTKREAGIKAYTRSYIPRYGTPFR